HIIKALLWSVPQNVAAEVLAANLDGHEDERTKRTTMRRQSSAPDLKGLSRNLYFVAPLRMLWRSYRCLTALRGKGILSARRHLLDELLVLECLNLSDFLCWFVEFGELPDDFNLFEHNRII
ncbi:MAG: hypothetical protein K8F25_05515, partial [Fimbriimonadaceae bacterium]|nr:hypothetical protein [Alphaproteobacteria bacterium]